MESLLSTSWTYDLPFLNSCHFNAPDSSTMFEMKISTSKIKAIFPFCWTQRAHCTLTEETLVTSVTRPSLPGKETSSGTGLRRERDLTACGNWKTQLNKNPWSLPFTTDALPLSRSFNYTDKHMPLFVKGKVVWNNALILRLLCSIRYFQVSVSIQSSVKHPTQPIPRPKNFP